jgi:ferritin-like protein
MGEHAGLHERLEDLHPETVERHRALISLIEELEAIDWYAQRVDACKDEALASVLAHNRDEEREHAAMTLEWLRRNDAEWDRVLRTYLFHEEPIVDLEAIAESGAPTSHDLGIGERREGR